jgi:hypothetical protein
MAGREAVQMPEQFGQLFVQILTARPAAKRAGSTLVGARRTADAEVDPAWEKALQRRPTLRHHKRRVVGQHDTARADPNPPRDRRRARRQDLRRRAPYAGHVVVLGVPQPHIAELIGQPGKRGCALQRGLGGLVAGDRHNVEQGQGDVEHPSRNASR